MILPYIEIPETVKTEKKISIALPEPGQESLANNAFIYGGGMIDHPVLDFKFAENPGIEISSSNSLLAQSETGFLGGNFEEKYLMYSEKIEKERFARELVAGKVVAGKLLAGNG